MKKYIVGVIIGIIIAIGVVSAANFQAVTADFPILINGEKWTPDDPAVVINDRTYLPLRALGEALGVPVNSNEQKQQVEIFKESDTKEYYQFGTVDNPIDLSLINLIATPERFHGKYVRVEGIGNLAFEGNALYFSKDDYEYHHSKNAVWLNVKSDFYPENVQYNGKVVRVEGQFDMNDDGHFDLFSGSLKNITLYECLEN